MSEDERMSEANDEQPEMTTGQRLRAEMKGFVRENDELRGDLWSRELRLSIADAGFDPESLEGKAIAKTFDPDADPTVDAVREFAIQEYDLQPVDAEQETIDAQERAAAERAEQISAAEDRVRMLGQGSLPPRSPGPLDELNEAEAKGDVNGMIRANLKLMHQQSRR